MADEKAADPKSLQQAVREAWLGLVSGAESEWHKATHKLLEALGVPEGGNLRDELLGRMRKNREDLERRIDEGVKAAVARVRAPIDREIATLKTRIEKLQARVEEERKKRADKKKG
jgi:hypothetical protein